MSGRELAIRAHLKLLDKEISKLSYRAMTSSEHNFYIYMIEVRTNLVAELTAMALGVTQEKQDGDAAAIIQRCS